MINLLPPQYKEELVREENWKLILILGIVILSFFISTSLILFSIKILSGGQLSAQKVLASQKEMESSQILEFEKKLRDLNLTLAQLSSFYQGQTSLVGISEIITKTLPAKVYLTSLSFNRISAEDYSIGVSLSGFAPSREILLELKKNLEDEALFKEIYFPPANWVQATDINFAVSFKVK